MQPRMYSPRRRWVAGTPGQILPCRLPPGGLPGAPPRFTAAGMGVSFPASRTPGPLGRPAASVTPALVTGWTKHATSDLVAHLSGSRL